uniref:Ground-like domain-containing protein n=1 Tax=Rhabditophanes sp. KR3021 TaxID=114890 RepID=A0AC35U2J1_9BILA
MPTTNIPVFLFLLSTVFVQSNIVKREAIVFNLEERNGERTVSLGSFSSPLIQSYRTAPLYENQQQFTTEHMERKVNINMPATQPTITLETTHKPHQKVAQPDTNRPEPTNTVPGYEVQAKPVMKQELKQVKLNQNIYEASQTNYNTDKSNENKSNPANNYKSIANNYESNDNKQAQNKYQPKLENNYKQPSSKVQNIYKATPKIENVYESSKNVENIYESSKRVENTYDSNKNVENTYDSNKNVENTYGSNKQPTNTYKQPIANPTTYHPQPVQAVRPLPRKQTSSSNSIKSTNSNKQGYNQTRKTKSGSVDTTLENNEVISSNPSIPTNVQPSSIAQEELYSIVEETIPSSENSQKVLVENAQAGYEFVGDKKTKPPGIRNVGPVQKVTTSSPPTQQHKATPTHHSLQTTEDTGYDIRSQPSPQLKPTQGHIQVDKPIHKLVETTLRKTTYSPQVVVPVKARVATTTHTIAVTPSRVTPSFKYVDETNPYTEPSTPIAYPTKPHNSKQQTITNQQRFVSSPPVRPRQPLRSHITTGNVPNNVNPIVSTNLHATNPHIPTTTTPQSNHQTHPTQSNLNDVFHVSPQPTTHSNFRGTIAQAVTSQTTLQPTKQHPSNNVTPTSMPKTTTRTKVVDENAPVDEGFDSDVNNSGTFNEKLCFTGEKELVCCSEELNSLIENGLKDFKKKKMNGCNLHKHAMQLGDLAEKQFKYKFEVIVSPVDFASKSRFRENLFCKTYREDKYIMMYAPPISSNNLL